MLDLLFLLFLIPVLGAARAEFLAHFPQRGSPRDRGGRDVDRRVARRDLLPDHPARGRRRTGRCRPARSPSSATVVLRVRRAGPLGPVAPAPRAMGRLHASSAATVAMGWEWTRGRFNAGLPRHRHRVHGRGTGARGNHVCSLGAPTPTRRTVVALARPILTSVSVVSACAALAAVASLDEARGSPPSNRPPIIAVLGFGVAARILANQGPSTQAHADARRALADKERACRKPTSPWNTSASPTRRSVNPRNTCGWSSRRPSTGIVELDHRDVILRTNEAFCAWSASTGAHRRMPWTRARGLGDGADLVRLAPRRPARARSNDPRASRSTSSPASPWSP